MSLIVIGNISAILPTGNLHWISTYRSFDPDSHHCNCEPWNPCPGFCDPDLDYSPVVDIPCRVYCTMGAAYIGMPAICLFPKIPNPWHAEYSVWEGGPVALMGVSIGDKRLCLSKFVERVCCHRALAEPHSLGLGQRTSGR